MSSLSGIGEGSSQRLAGGRAPLRWQCWPLRDDALRSAMVLGGLLGVGLLVRWITGQTHLALAAAGLLGATFWRYFVPITYELNDRGLERRVLGRQLWIGWEAIQRWEAGPDGVLVYLQSQPGLWGWFRAIYVPWGPDVQQLLGRLRAYCGQVEFKPVEIRPASNRKSAPGGENVSATGPAGGTSGGSAQGAGKGGAPDHVSPEGVDEARHQAAETATRGEPSEEIAPKEADENRA